MKVILVQEGQDVYSMVNRLLKMNKTNMTKVCKENKLKYSTVIQRLQANQVDQKFLKSLVKKINKDARIKIEFSVSLIVDNEEITNLNSK